MTEILIKKKNIVMDATLLSSFQGCERYCDLRFNHCFESQNGKSNSLECGSIAHKILEEFYLHRREGTPRAQALGYAFTAGELYITGCQYCTDFIPTEQVPKPRCGHQPDEYPGVQNTPPDNEKKPKRTGWKWVLETMDQYFKFYPNETWEPLVVEEVEGKMLYEDDEIRVYWKAKFDLIARTNGPNVLPVDHKTMSQDRSGTKMHNQFMGQCFIAGVNAMCVNKIGWQLSKPPEEKFKRVMHNYTTDGLLEWQSEIVPYWAYRMLTANESGYYPPRFTQCENKYGTCEFYEHVCGVDRNMRETGLRTHFRVGRPWDPANA